MEMGVEKDVGLNLSAGQPSNQFGILALACDLGACLLRAERTGVMNAIEHVRPRASIACMMGSSSGQPKRAWPIDFDAG